MSGEQPATIRIGDGEPFEVSGIRLVWERQTPDGPVLSWPLPFEFDFDCTALVESLWAEVRAARVDEAAAKLAQEWRRRWSGPDRLQRQVARAYGIPARVLLPAPPSVLDGRYRRRQRNRAKRRRR